jgi:hypothetical protein
VDFGSKWLASYTQAVTEETLSHYTRPRELKAPPILFQERIVKEFEVRVFYRKEGAWGSYKTQWL